MKFKKANLIFLTLAAVLLIAAVSLSGCLDSDDHFDGDGHDHDHGDSNATYDPLDNESVNQVLNGSKILVAVSVVPQTEFVEKVGGDKVIAISMIPPGAGHTYDPSPRQLEDLSKADLYMALNSGEPFETNNMQTFTELNSNMTVMNSSAGITLIQKNNSTDPHIWTSPKNAIVMVENTYMGLASVDLANESYYRANADAYIQELESLDAELANELSDLSSRNFMVYHPAWGYFARDYNLTQIAVEVDGKEPAPKDIVKFIDLAKENNISVIFVQEQVSVSGATAIAEGFNGSVYVIDPLAKNYVENMRKVGQVLAENMA
ncbi:metal ABC transporter solute-binding protein, Zn/Mn family [Methanimicrococcus blatticola]|uniref:Zinc transport system substrate-binding protein n=1 Tax=Methanimicrococcus blatticola TaxID=91560 RepID=A0A484F4I6_9EURY|nr:zinc ABC transporter substrate-binding protein [Methanimicrococcus blatticola]MBZ3935460.1 zinc ABC transporter substrate-binding protein [Methanimicrococcus blatticola]MCC2509104.1 zinc ABC transporter substrate-binding protein [Methanimicrococcus blatticola]TDQ69527.1 zinc transport system substrate-binding protein [Methanimicrococcus blatticola]